MALQPYLEMLVFIAYARCILVIADFRDCLTHEIALVSLLRFLCVRWKDKDFYRICKH